MKISPRHVPTEKARDAIASAIILAADEHDLSVVEILDILNEEIARRIRYMLKDERHET